MRVLVDTSFWSSVLRRKSPEENNARLLSLLIEEFKVVMIGPIRQELLSGVTKQTHFDHLKSQLTEFPNYAIETEDYELAAHYYNLGRENGIQGSHIDYLICAVSVANDLEILTLDKDFKNYQNVLPIKLYSSS